MTSGFVAGFLGAILAALVVAMVDTRFRHPAKISVLDPAKEYPRKTLLRISAFFVAAAWACIVIVGLTILLGWAGVPVSGTIFLVEIAFLSLVATVYALLAFQIRCQSCHRHILVQWTTKPKYAESFFRMDGWTTIILRVLKRRPFRCMYCGQTYDP